MRSPESSAISIGACSMSGMHRWTRAVLSRSIPMCWPRIASRRRRLALVAARRYDAHFDLNLYRERAILFGDVNTDRDESSAVRPTELDWIIGIALRWHDIEFSVYRQQDRPVDRSGFVQEYWAASCALRSRRRNEAKILARV